MRLKLFLAKLRRGLWFEVCGVFGLRLGPKKWLFLPRTDRGHEVPKVIKIELLLLPQIAAFAAGTASFVEKKTSFSLVIFFFKALSTLTFLDSKTWKELLPLDS